MMVAHRLSIRRPEAQVVNATGAVIPNRLRDSSKRCKSQVVMGANAFTWPWDRRWIYQPGRARNFSRNDTGTDALARNRPMYSTPNASAVRNGRRQPRRSSASDSCSRASRSDAAAISRRKVRQRRLDGSDPFADGHAILKSSPFLSWRTPPCVHFAD